MPRIIVNRFLPERQIELFHEPPRFDPFPPIHRDFPGFLQTLGEAWAAGYVGFDLEFDDSEHPTILGIASPQSAAALPWDSQLALQVVDGPAQLVAHAGAGADAPVVKAATGRHVPLERWEDSMLLHYLLGQDYAAQPGKDEDDDDKMALGLMNLWATASYWLEIPQWKACRGRGCRGPCPRHDPFGYCAIDAWAGLNSFLNMKAAAGPMQLPWRCYRELMKLAVVCDLMEKRGVVVDMGFINDLELQFEQHKAGIFPHEMKNGRRVFGTWDEKAQEFVPAPFSPNSPTQLIEYFSHEFSLHPKLRNIQIPAVQKKDVTKILMTMCDRLGVDYKIENEIVFVEVDENTPKVITDFYGVYQWKYSGKGLKGWFDEKYLDKKNRGYDDKGNLIRAIIHPRFIPTGASTGRLASSKPNFQNIPLRGWAAMVRQAIVPREPNHDILKADCKQLELRACLYDAEAPMPTGDAFTWLAESVEAFQKFDNPRQMAKSVSHACLTGDHEVLTPSGWKRIDHCANGEVIAQWEPDGSVTFVEVQKFLRFAVDEELVSITGRGFSQVTTDNHCLPILTSGTWQGHQYQNLHKQEVTKLFWSGRIPITGRLVSTMTSYISDVEIKQAVAIQADAHRKERTIDLYEFHLHKKRKQDRLENIFGIVGQDCGCGKGGKRYTVRFSSPLLDYRKRFTHELLQLDQRQREIFLHEVLLWDGSINAKSTAYNNSDYESVRWVQTLAHLSGREALIRNGGVGSFPGSSKNVYKVSFNQRQYAQVNRLTMTRLPFKGEVYCFTVPSGFFLVRHNHTISVTGNSDYLEGLVLKWPWELQTARTKKEIEIGALKVFKDWTFRGQVVCFTGANLGQRLFGDKSYESRKKANEIQEHYFARFPQLRAWHKRISKEIEDNGYVRSRSGRFLYLNGTPEEQMKIGAAFKGQGQSAEHMADIMVRYWEEMNEVWTIQVHDEAVVEKPSEWTDQQCREWTQIMEEETWRFPGFKCPIDLKRGPNWGKCKAL